MSVGRREGQQSDLWIAHKDVVGAPAHRFYEKLNELLAERVFDREVEALCVKYYAASDKAGRPSIPRLAMAWRWLFENVRQDGRATGEGDSCDM